MPRFSPTWAKVSAGHRTAGKTPPAPHSSLPLLPPPFISRYALFSQRPPNLQKRWSTILLSLDACHLRSFFYPWIRSSYTDDASYPSPLIQTSVPPFM